MRISVVEYAKSIGKTRGTVYEWIRARKVGKKCNMPSDARVEWIAGHPVINVKGKKNV